MARCKTRGDTTDFNSASRAVGPSLKTAPSPNNFATERVSSPELGSGVNFKPRADRLNDLVTADVRRL